jgi:hypothetical protein
VTTLTKPVRRETSVLYRRRPLVVNLTPRFIEIREKGRRDVLSVGYDVIYEFAMKLRFRQEQTEKRKKGGRK